jgi:DNA-binding LacI/PurR family transcriptional regulator
MATIVEVAERAGVGIGTVSRVLNNTGAVKAETRERVLKAIDELNFRPNQAARQLVTARTGTIAVVLPYLTRPFFVNVLHGVEAMAAARDYHLQLFNVETEEKRRFYLREMPYHGRIDGLLVVSLPVFDVAMSRLAAARIPTVLVDTYHPQLPSITVDNVAGARLAVEHLIACGHQRIAYICGPIEAELKFPVNQQRLQGYQAALGAHGIPVVDTYIISGADSHVDGMRMTYQLLDLDPRPTAIFAASDVHALGALQAAGERGLRVPQDLAIVGYDDIDLAGYMSLTTVRQPMVEMGRRGVEMLLDQVDGRQSGERHMTLPVELVVRRSTVDPEHGDQRR